MKSLPLITLLLAAICAHAQFVVNESVTVTTNKTVSTVLLNDAQMEGYIDLTISNGASATVRISTNNLDTFSIQRKVVRVPVSTNSLQLVTLDESGSPVTNTVESVTYTDAVVWEVNTKIR